MEVEPRLTVVENATVGDNPSRLGSLIHFKDPRALWEDNWFAVVLEATAIFLFLLAYRHARGRGERQVFFLASLIIGAFGIETLQQIRHSGYQLWWYHEGIINLMWRKVPLYLLCLCAVTLYFLDYMNRKMNFPVFAQAFVNACSATLLLMPCLTLAPNLLLVLFHSSDAVFEDRVYNVPYTQITYLLLLYFHCGHLYNSNVNSVEPSERNTFTYFKSCLQSGIVSPMYSLVEVYLLCIIFKLIVESNAVLCLLSSLIILGYMSRDRMNCKVQTDYFMGFSSIIRRKEWICLLAFFCFVLAVPLYVHPEGLKSSGERLEYGPCDTIEGVSNISPLDTFRRRYICPNDTERYGFDFHCVSEKEIQQTRLQKNYTICGIPYEDPGQMFKTMLIYFIACSGILCILQSISAIREDKELVESRKKVD